MLTPKYQQHQFATRKEKPHSKCKIELFLLLLTKLNGKKDFRTDVKKKKHFKKQYTTLLKNLKYSVIIYYQAIT